MTFHADENGNHESSGIYLDWESCIELIKDCRAHGLNDDIFYIEPVNSGVRERYLEYCFGLECKVK